MLTKTKIASIRSERYREISVYSLKTVVPGGEKEYSIVRTERGNENKKNTKQIFEKIFLSERGVGIIISGESIYFLV